MRQNTLKLNNLANTISIVNNSNLEKKIFNYALVLLGFLSVVYIFILGNTTLSVIERKALLEEEHALTNELGDLELQYLSLSSKINLNYAYSVGYKEAKATYANRANNGFAKLNFENSLTKNNTSIKFAKNEF